jgi:hypothetical protein
MKHITRIERKHSGYGWLVRYRGQAKWFSDSRFGSALRAQQAARFYLAEIKKKNRPPQPKSGVPGVVKAVVKSGEKSWDCYVVQIKSAGIYKRFYPHRYRSDSKALQEAIEFRRRMEAQMQENPELMKKKKVATL